MELSINAEKLVKDLSPAINIATKHTDKYFENSGLVCLKTTSKKTTVIAHCGTAATEIPIHANSYSGMKKGSFAVNAIDFEKSLSSFPACEEIILSIKDNDLKISKASNTDEYNIIPISQMEIKFPNVDKKFQKRLTVNRDIFVKGLKKVKSAMGKFETQSYYMCLQLKASKSELRFVAGSGARFSVDDFNGDHITNVSESVSVILPWYNIPNIIKILTGSDSEHITIKEAEEALGTPAQIIIEFDKNRVMLLGVDASIDYPDVDAILNLDYPCQVSVDTEDWKSAMKAIVSTNTQKVKRERDVHAVKITADPKRGHFILEAKTDATAVRTVPFTLYHAGSDVSTNEIASRWFSVNSTYLEEMATKAGKAKEMTIAFEGISTTADTTEKKLKPVLVRYPHTLDKSGVSENHCMFFACSKVHSS